MLSQYGTVSHLPDVNRHYLVYACQTNHTCPASRYCVLDEAFDFSFSERSNCSCSSRHVQWDRDEHLPGVIRQKQGCEVCLHKALWPLEATDYFGAAMLSLGAIMSGAVGIGGGGLGVPILVILGFNARQHSSPCHHLAITLPSRLT